MKLSTFGYYLHETLRSLRRHTWMTVASVVTVSISLFLLGLFSLAAANAQQVASGLESELEIAVFLRQDAPPEVVQEVGATISRLPGVASVELVPKEEGLALLAQQFGSEHDLLRALGGENPLPDYYRVKADRPEDVAGLARTVAGINYVDTVNYGQELVDRLLEFTSWIRWFGMATVILLAAAALALIANTIRLAVFARGEEISIMKYIGATDWFVRWPFFLQGMLLGLIGAIVAVVCLYWVYSATVGSLQISLAFLPIYYNYDVFWQLAGALVVAGMVVGAVGSLISMRRFLGV